MSTKRSNKAPAKAGPRGRAKSTPARVKGTRMSPKNGGGSAISKVSMPFNEGVAITSSVPAFNGKDTVRVVHREAVASIRNTTLNTFAMLPQVGQNPGWDIAPGNPVLFPWLSNIAVNYEQYHFHRLAFRLVSGQAASVNGRVYMAVDYDWDDEIADSYGSMMNNRTAVEGPVWGSLVLNCDPSALHEDRFYKYTMNAVREAPEPRTTYGGFLMIATNTPTACNFDLVVEYDVEFKSPQGAGIPQFVASLTPNAALPFATTGSGSQIVKLPLPTLRGVTKVTVPDQAMVAGVSLGGSEAIDLAAMPNSLVELGASVAQSNLSPVAISSVCPTNPLRYEIYDQNWALLGDSLATGAASYLAPYDPQQLASPGQPVVSTTVVSPVSTRLWNAAARFLVPILNLGPLASLLNPAGSTSLKVEL